MAQLVQHGVQVPLLKIASLITGVKNVRLWIEVDTANREIDGLLVWDLLPVGVHDLLSLVEVDLAHDR